MAVPVTAVGSIPDPALKDSGLVLGNPDLSGFSRAGKSELRPGSGQVLQNSGLGPGKSRTCPEGFRTCPGFSRGGKLELRTGSGQVLKKSRTRS